MKNEIKEILDYFRKYMSIDDCIRLSKIEDCITNLQEENKRLKEELQQEKKDFKEANDYCFELKDYKLRNEKAIELLKEAGCYDEERKTFCDDIWEELPKLLNILQGDDKDVNITNQKEMV